MRDKLPDDPEQLKQELDEVSKQLSGTHSELLAILDSMQGQ
ncbi:hypothetical protein [Haloquadratum walsbyi]|jgi:hypothetical protein|nr:hypothetical protein [Haloquadratum walsbyi]